MSKMILPASIAVLALGLSAPSFAQEYSINGQMLPEDQVERFQAHCDEMFMAEGGTAVDSAGAAESTTNGGDGTTGSDSSDTSGSMDWSTYDMASLDAEACRTAGFSASAAGGADAAGAVQGSNATGTDGSIDVTTDPTTGAATSGTSTGDDGNSN